MLAFLLGAVFGWATLTYCFLIYVYFSLKKQNEEFEEWKETIRKPPE